MKLNLVFTRSFLFLLAPVVGFLGVVQAQETDIEGFERILQRGAISSIDDPKFVSAEEAEIGEDAWILGVVVGGEARAYSLNLLNHHEIVNDEISGKPVAAVW